MPLTLQVGFDTDVIGEYRIREGKIEAVAPDEETRKDLERRLETKLAQMAESEGFDEEKVTAESALRWVHEHSAQGRNWTHLVEDTGS
jgi:hypothetical protein